MSLKRHTIYRKSIKTNCKYFNGMVNLKRRLNLNKKINFKPKLKNSKFRTSNPRQKTKFKNRYNRKSMRVNRIKQSSTNSKILASKIVWIKYLMNWLFTPRGWKISANIESILKIFTMINLLTKN